ncbi:DUF2183 domain-containing protein, partial [Georgenia sp. 10Sc9-8]|nr:DUF2183 domain-containing protein [Georgenia halotolerans]
MRLGVLADLDGSLGLTALQRPLRTAGYRVEPARDRRSVMGVAGVLRMLARTVPDTPFHYLSASPRVALPYIRRAMRNDGYPPGRLEHARTARQVWRGEARWFKRDVLDETLRSDPERRWVLLGDDGDHDPPLFAAAARRFPDQVAAIAIRNLAEPDHALGERMRRRAGEVPVITAGTGEELMPELVDVLGLQDPDTPIVLDWFLTAAERGNEATAQQTWTEGNAVEALVHGREYFAALHREVAEAGPGDAIMFGGWRADVDELLRDDGPAGARALADAVRRGASVQGLLWRSHHPAVGFSSVQNRRFAREVNAAGGEVVLDQRVRPTGSHHQKFVVVRHGGGAARDVAFVGGLDVARSRRDGAEHTGDTQTRAFAAVYGPTPPWHDAQLRVQGPAVRDVEEVFRERWQDPAPLTLAPWRAARDRKHGLGRENGLPTAAPAPPAAGSCTVQLLRTYPRRTPAYPFAPHGERSVARAYAKALNRARRLIYVEDQYLWSSDVARVFATALQRSPELCLIAVVPRYPDQESPIRVPSAGMGQSAAMEMVRDAGGERVQVLDLENEAGTPIYIHAKLCIVDDVWAAVGSANLSRRSWTHDSELVAAVLDDERDPREPRDPGGRGDEARRFARELRLSLLREHLGRAEGDDADLLDPDDVLATVRDAAGAM